MKRSLEKESAFMAAWLSSSKQPHVSANSEPHSSSSQVQVSPNNVSKLNDEAVYDNDHDDNYDHLDDVYSWSIANEPEENEDQIGSPKSVPSTSSSNHTQYNSKTGSYVTDSTAEITTKKRSWCNFLA